MQAITTKYHGPSNVRGSRIIARASAGSVTMGYRHELNLEENHIAAAELLREKMGWVGPGYGALLSGCDHNEDYVHVMTGER